MAFCDDPELVATFRAEVDERLSALSAGLLELDRSPDPRPIVRRLFRDAHTLKGSARLMAAHEVVEAAHRAEELLGALRDGRAEPTAEVVDQLLASCDEIRRLVGAGPQPAHPSAAAPAIPSPRPSQPADAESGPPAGPDHVASIESMRVRADRVHGLVDAVGEAETTGRRIAAAAASLRHASRDSAELSAAGELLAGLAEHSAGQLAGLRTAAMGLAMVPVRRITDGLPRVLRDVAAAKGVTARLEVLGGDVELDKQVLDAVADALGHLVVNAVDHGCEPAARRRAAGKPEAATVTVSARAAGDRVVIAVSDDGAGVDEAQVRGLARRRGLREDAPLLDLLATPSFTTMEQATRTSGRGVGLDAVLAAVAAVNGHAELVSRPGDGTTVTLTLPVSLGVVRCLIARVGDERYALPVASIVQTVSLRHTRMTTMAGAPVVVWQGLPVPVVNLASALAAPGAQQPRAALVVSAGERMIAIAVDALERECEVVVKPLGGFLGRPPLICGGVIDDDGRLVLLLEPRELRPGGTTVVAPAPSRQRSILVVDDSVGIRELQRLILESAGYAVRVAVDGAEAATLLAGSPPDLVITDVEMPGLDGLSLIRRIRATPTWAALPVVVMTSRDGADEQRAGLAAGADAYLLKQEFDDADLVGTVRRLLGESAAGGDGWRRS